jgi:signal transduction histidine kinase
MPRLNSLVARASPGRRTRILVVGASGASIVAVALMDYVTGINLSLSVFYLVPVVAVTVTVSARAGFGLCGLTAAAWTLADALVLHPDASVLLQTWNGLLRFCTLSIVVALLAALRHSLLEAQASEQRSKEFLAYAAHQLRTPIAGVRASAEALVLTESPSRREQLATNLTVEADRLGRLVRSLLRLTRLDQGDPIQPVPCDVEELLRAEIERVRILAPHLEVSLQAPQGRPPTDLLLDPVAVAEIVSNLLDNARRHATDRVDVTLDSSFSQLRVSVADDGPGLPAGAENRAFERFVSMDGHSGSGLGLSIARSLAVAHGGELVYAVRRFVVALPAVRHEQDASRSETLAAGGRGRTGARGRGRR